MNSTLRNRVMSRIYLEYTKNLIVEKPDYFMFIIFVMVSFTLISFRNVLENLPKDSLTAAFNFFIVALKNTDWVLKMLAGAFIVRLGISGAFRTYRIFQSKAQLLPKLASLDSNSKNSAL